VPSGGKYLDRRVAAAWVCALVSTLGLPWGGIPVSYYAGAGSWVWFLFAGISIAVNRGDGRSCCRFRRSFALLNVGAIVAALFAFMYNTGVPGDIPGIEGIAAINSLEGLSGPGLACARILFFISGIASFAAVYSPGERAHVLMSFSYSSFMALAFLPPARAFFAGLSPRAAILADAAAYFAAAWLVHSLVMRFIALLAAPRWKYSYAAVNAAVTGAGIYFLFSSL
jgi:hypothetical protein